MKLKLFKCEKRALEQNDKYERAITKAKATVYLKQTKRHKK